PDRCAQSSSLPSSSLAHPPATPQASTLSLHDALPISPTLVGVHGLALARGGGKLAVWPDSAAGCWGAAVTSAGEREITTGQWRQDRKSTRLNSSHVKISYAVFCLKKKKRGRLLLRRCT